MTYGRSLARIAPGLFLAAHLVACGGGGGGGGGGGVSNPPPTAPPVFNIPVPNYSGNVSAATLSKVNASEFAAAVVAARSIVALGESAWIDVLGANGDVSQTIAGPAGGSARVSGSLSNGVGTIEVIYDQFRVDSITIDGRYVQRSEAETAGSPGFIYFDIGPGTLGFDDLQITTPDATLSMRGSMRISGGNKQNVDLNLTVLEVGSGEVAFFENLDVDFTTETIAGSPLFGVSLQGRVYDGTEGYVDVRTEAPLVDLDVDVIANAVVAQRGGVRLRANGGDVYLEALSLAFASVGIDVDGDTVPDEFRRVRWRELSGIIESTPSYISGPVANAGNRLFGHVNAPVRMDGRFSHDDDGDWLRYEWQLVSKPPGSQYDLPPVSAAGIEFLPDVEGDYLFELRVSDGTLGAHTGLIVDVGPETLTPLESRTNYASLELAAPVQLGASNIVDGRGSAVDPYRTAPTWFVEGDGNETWTTQDDGLVIDYTTDTIGRKQVRFETRTSRSGYPSDYAEFEFFAGRDVPDLAYELVDDYNGDDVIVGDYNGDGDDDLLVRVSGLGVVGVRVLVADGGGRYTPQAVVPSPEGEIAAGDLNGDGRLDYAVAGDDAVQVFYQQSDGSTAPAVRVDYPDDDCTLSSSAGDIGIIDIDGDNRDDLAAEVACKNALITWQQQPDGSLGAPVEQALGENIANAEFLDVNGDGRGDAVLGVFSNGALNEAAVVALGQPDGTLLASDRFAFDAFGAPVAAAGDVNGDGRVDILSIYPGYLEIYERQADGSAVQAFAAGLPPLVPNPGKTTVVDIDKDGLQDLLFCDFRDLAVGFQTAPYRFDFAKIGTCSEGTSAAAVVYDYDRDGVDDIVSTSQDAQFGRSDKLTMLYVLFGGLKAYSVPR